MPAHFKLFGMLLVAAKIASAGEVQLFPFSSQCHHPGADVDEMHTFGEAVNDECLIYEEGNPRDLYSVGLSDLTFDCPQGSSGAFFGYTNDNCAGNAPTFTFETVDRFDCYDFGGKSFQSFKFHCCDGPVAANGCADADSH